MGGLQRKVRKRRGLESTVCRSSGSSICAAVRFRCEMHNNDCLNGALVKSILHFKISCVLLFISFFVPPGWVGDPKQSHSRSQFLE